MSVWNFADQLAAVPVEHRISLGEGNTPLVRSRRIGPSRGVNKLYFKLESCNPTGSYKDRFAAVAVSRMLADGKRRCIATSSGNTGAALAAYSAAAKLACDLAIVEFAPHEKLLQMLAYGANLKRIRGLGCDPQITQATFARIEELAKLPEVSREISAYCYSPLSMTGVETISHELAAQAASTGEKLEHIFVPAGGGGLALAIARGFARRRSNHASEHSPSVHVVQPSGNDTIAGALKSGSDVGSTVVCSTAISGLQVATVLDGNDTIRECRQSGGTGFTVSDEQIWNTQAELARQEGLFVEPAGAVALAGALQAIERGEIPRNATIVCITTGTGHKDQASVQRMTAATSVPTIDLIDL